MSLVSIRVVLLVLSSLQWVAKLLKMGREYSTKKEKMCLILKKRRGKPAPNRHSRLIRVLSPQHLANSST